MERVGAFGCNFRIAVPVVLPDVAAILTVVGADTIAGATYSPWLDIVPTELFPPAIPLTDQLNVFRPAFAVAVNC